MQDELKPNRLVELTVEDTKTNKTQTFRCKKLISSLPLNQYHSVKFKPELPCYKRNFFQFCKMGYLVKIIVTYETSFWRAKGYSGEVISGINNYN
jgi:monoamine oxidase